MSYQLLLTIDVEDWFHICGVKDQIPKSSWPYLESRVTQNTHKILAILSEKGVKATFFVLGFVFYATLFVGIGSIVTTEQEAQQIQLI